MRRLKIEMGYAMQERITRGNRIVCCLSAAVLGLSALGFSSAAFSQQNPPHQSPPPNQQSGPQEPRLEDYTPAQRLLYATNHLKAVGVSDVLNYNFQRQGTLDAPFDDKASLTVSSVGDDGKKTLTVDFLSGDRHIDIPPLAGFNGNPILMVFLEHDVKEMSDFTKGSTLFFRNRIRDAFATAEKAKITPTTVTVDGKSVPAKLLVLEPYVGVAEVDRFRKFEHKSYQFVIGDDVPGGIYSIRTVTPAEDGKGDPVMTETLSYQSKNKS